MGGPWRAVGVLESAAPLRTSGLGFSRVGEVGDDLTVAHERHLRIHRVVLEFDGQNREDLLDEPAIGIDNAMHILAATEGPLAGREFADGAQLAVRFVGDGDRHELVDHRGGGVA